MESRELRIDGMSCGHCVARVSAALKALAGVAVDQVEVGRARIRMDHSKVTTAQVTAALEEAGFEARVEDAR